VGSISLLPASLSSRACTPQQGIDPCIIAIEEKTIIAQKNEQPRRYLLSILRMERYKSIANPIKNIVVFFFISGG